MLSNQNSIGRDSQSRSFKGPSLGIFLNGIFWVVPLPRMLVTTRIIIFLVGNPYKPFFATVTGRGDNPRYFNVFYVLALLVFLLSFQALSSSITVLKADRQKIALRIFCSKAYFFWYLILLHISQHKRRYDASFASRVFQATSRPGLEEEFLEDFLPEISSI